MSHIRVISVTPARGTPPHALVLTFDYSANEGAPSWYSAGIFLTVMLMAEPLQMKNKSLPGPRPYVKVAPLGMAKSLIQPLPLLFVGVFARDIVFGNFFRANFALVGIEGV